MKRVSLCFSCLFEFDNFQIQSIHTEGTVACYIVTDSHDKFAYIANYVGGTGCSIALNPDGTMSKGAVAKYVGTTGIVPERQEGPHMHAVKLGVGEKFVYLTDLGNDRVVKLNFDPIVGFSESSSEYYDTQPGSGPRHLTFHPNGSYLYVANELSNTVDVFKINALDGSLKHLQTIGTLPNDFKVIFSCFVDQILNPFLLQEESFVAEILISSDAKFLYVSNRGHNSLAIFSVSTDGSSLKSIGYQSTKGECPRNFNIIDDILLVANQNSDNIVPFKIAADGSLIEIGQILMCPKPVCLKFLEL